MGLDAIALRDHRARAAGAWTPRDHMRPRCHAQTSAVSVVSADTRVDEEQPDREGCGHGAQPTSQDLRLTSLWLIVFKKKVRKAGVVSTQVALVAARGLPDLWSGIARTNVPGPRRLAEWFAG